MAEENITARIKLKGDTTANWENSDRKLAEYEVGVERTTDGGVNAKIGDGKTGWNALGYAFKSSDIDKLNVLATEFTTEYGIRWVTGSSACEGERCVMSGGVLLTGDATGLSFSVSADGAFISSYDSLPIWGEMKRITIANQVMVRIPKYYIKRETVDGYDYVWVCKQKKTGYRCAGIFLDADGVTEKDCYYIGAYECSNGALGLSQTDKAYSTTDKQYNTGYNITEYREAAQKLGDGWGITTIAEVCDFWQVIPLIEFGTKDVQSVTPGICELIDGPFDEMYTDDDGNVKYQYRTGMCDDVENLNGTKLYYSTGENANYNNQTGIHCGMNPFVYRGIENPYGCIEKYVDGLTFYNNADWYATNDRSAFTTDSATGYAKLDYTLSSMDGYVKTLTTFDNAPYCTLPSELDEDFTEGQYYPDEFYAYGQSKKYIYPSFGGDCNDGGYAGLWYLDVNYTSSGRDGYVGARLSYSPV